MLKVKDLYIYPVKGLAGISLQKVEINQFGLQWDRQWMLVDQNGLFLSQRKAPKMALFQTELEGNHLIVSYQSHSITIDLEHQRDDLIEVEVWNQKMKAHLVSTEVDQWFSQHLGMQVTFVRYGKKSNRTKKKEYAEMPLKFVDGYPILLTVYESLSNLNQHLENKISMNRFRPNIVLSGAKAWDEFKWKSIKHPKGTLFMAKPCERCSVTSINQKTAEKDKKEPLKSLIKLHGSPALFGMNCYAKDDFSIKVGDVLDG